MVEPKWAEVEVSAHFKVDAEAAAIKAATELHPDRTWHCVSSRRTAPIGTTSPGAPWPRGRLWIPESHERLEPEPQVVGRHCPSCGLAKGRDEFAVDRHQPDYLSKLCLACIRDGRR